MKHIVIIDYGSQYTHLIKMRLRERGHEAVIAEPDAPQEMLKNACGLILSGGPQSVYEEGAPQLSEELKKLIFENDMPTLAICYGMQLIARHACLPARQACLAGRQAGKRCWECVEPGKVGEYGRATIALSHQFGVLKGLLKREIVWMSHGDSVVRLPPNFRRLSPAKFVATDPHRGAHAHPENPPITAMAHISKPIFCLQFHPEVSHTRSGKKILKNFLEICGAEKNWDENLELERMKESAKRKINARHVFAFISGGNDSSVLVCFLREIVPKERLHLFYIRGLGADEDLEKISIIGNVRIVDARKSVYNTLRGVLDPEEKRHRIGELFVRVFKKEAEKLAERLGYSTTDLVLAQGTIHPDRIESGSSRHSEKIKSHHNTIVQQLIGEKNILEPFGELFKPDIRKIGKILDIDNRLISQHPSPGPGHVVRFLCAERRPSHGDTGFNNAKRRETALQKMCAESGYAAWVLPLKSKGVQGDQASYCHTAGIVGPYERTPLLALANEIPNRFKGTVNRVIYLVAPRRVKTLSLASFKADYFCAKTRDMVERANRILVKNLRVSNLYPLISQAFVVIAPLSNNKLGYSAIIRAVNTEDYMTAEPFWLPETFLQQVAEEIIRTIPEIHMVFYDLTSKPPGTIEWE